MLAALKSYFSQIYYIRIAPERLHLLDVASGREISDLPVVAIDESDGRDTVLAVGAEALGKDGQPGVRLANGFKHPRTPLADFLAAEITLKHLVKHLARTGLFTPSPIMVLHPLTDWAGGLTPIEIRAFRELAIGAGARAVYLWQGEVLSAETLRDLDFSRSAGRLLDR